MARRIFIVRKRGGLFNLEVGILSLLAGYEVVATLHWPWWGGIAAFFATIAGLVLIFFSSKVLMYFLATLFSVGWATLAFRFVHQPAQGGTLVGGVLAGIAVAALSLWAHKRTFEAFNSEQVEVVDEL